MTEVAKHLSLAEALLEVKRYDWEGDYREVAKEAVKDLIEHRMENGIDAYLNELAAAGGPPDRRNGYYERHLSLEVGDVVLSVPRTRRLSGASVLGKFRRRSRHVERLILDSFLLGHSTRKVGQALLPLLGERVSASLVSEVAKQLDGMVAAYHRRSLTDRYRVLLFDGVVVKRRTGMGSVKRVILVALGILADGRKEVIDFYQARSESQEEWEAFLNDLYRRGAKNLKVARREAGRWAAKWEKKYPQAVACLRDDLDSMLAFFRFEPSWRSQVRTTNAIERRFVEVRRRTRPMGVFSDRTSVERILFAVLMHENFKQKVNPLLVVTQNT